MQALRDTEAQTLESFCRLAGVVFNPNTIDATTDRLLKVIASLSEARKAEKTESKETKSHEDSNIKARKQRIQLAVCGEIEQLCMALLLLQPACMPPDAAPIAPSITRGEIKETAAVLPPASLHLTRTLSAFNRQTSLLVHRKKPTISEEKAAAKPAIVSGGVPSQGQVPQIPQMPKPSLSRVYSDLPRRGAQQQASEATGQGVTQLREWIDSFRRWKQWNSLEDAASESARNALGDEIRNTTVTPEDAVEALIKGGIKGKQLVDMSQSHRERAKGFIQGLRWLITALNAVHLESA
eukprot:786131-Amorphochlora_amoeboformis.AAC.1